MGYRIYTHYLDVTTYPGYKRRAVCVPSWETFDNNTQFTCLRTVAQVGNRLTSIAQELDHYTVEHQLGRVIWPHFFLYKAENLEELVVEIKRRDLFLFDIWGFVPGMVPTETQGFGHLVPTAEQLALFHRELGDHFLGIDNGEQDGRYISSYASQMCPAPLDHRAQLMNFHRHFRHMSDELGNHLSALISLTAAHYFIKEGDTVLVGAETAQALPNSQVYYSFIRGAGKQYGVHWFGNASCFNRWGYKRYDVDTGAGQINDWEGNFGPEKGASLALLKRLMWSHIMYDSVLAGFELGYFCGDEPDAKLSPIGQVQVDAQRIVKERGRAGVHLAPLALMLDFYAGWVPARHLYSRKAYQCWGNMPFGPGDYLTHSVFNVLYPGYENSSYYHDERGFLSPTPYGDIADVMLSDAPAWTMAQYQTVIIATELQSRLAEVAHNLREYARQGGSVVLTAANAIRLGSALTGLEVSQETERLEAGTSVLVGQDRVEEPHAFVLHRCEPGPESDVLACCGDLPAAVSHPLGDGQVITLLTPYGLNAQRLVQGPVVIEVDKPLPQPYVLCQHVLVLLDRLLGELSPFSVGDGLGYVACRREPGSYEVLVQNNTLEPKPFAISSRLGQVTGIQEVTLGSPVEHERGYRPGGYESADLGEETDTQIAGLSTRLFEVRLREQDVTELPAVVPPPPPVGRGLTVSGLESLEKEVLLRPTFSQHYDTLCVSWRYLGERAGRFLVDEASWLNRQRTRRIVNFTDGLNHYPDLTLLDNCPGQWERSREMILDVLDKMQATGCDDAIITLTRGTEGRGWDEGQLHPLFQKTVTELCELAGVRGITLHLQNHPHRWYPSSREMLHFVEAVDHPNLKYCLNAGHLLSYHDEAGKEENLLAALEEAGERCELVLLSAPFVDASELVYDAHLPVVGSAFEDAIVALAQRAGRRTLVLDVLYPDQDAEFTDAHNLFG